MKKKLWEIPRLKMGATTKRDDDDGLDSPPPTPKSVVPPLPPGVDYELRTACALVLQDFKPSDYVYHERFGDADDDDPHLDRKAQLDYAAFMQTLEDEEVAAPLDPVNTRVLLNEPRTHIAALDKAVPSLPRAVSEKTNGQAYSDGLWKRVRGEEDNQRSPPPARPPPTQSTLEKRAAAHKRSASQPIKLTGAPLYGDFAIRPKMERANTTQTPASTPGSDGTDHAAPASTAPTTAAITPAPHSDRVFGHQRTKSADTKIGVVDGEWMRRELERHKHAQEEDNARYNLDGQSQGVNGHIEAFSPSTTHLGDAISPVVQDAEAMQVTKAAAPAVHVPARKPVPRASVDGTRNGGAGQGVGNSNRASVDLRRSISQKRRSTPRSESRAELEYLESNRQSREQSRATPPDPDAPVITYYYPRQATGVRAPAPSANLSRAPSRSRSITRQIKELVRRPSIGSRKQSIELERPSSRARSIDSTRSGVSGMSSSDPSSSKWKSWIPFHRAQSSTTSVDDVGQDSRGRDAARDGKDSKPKPPINLNRELPPLPSLDQWKDDDVEDEPPVPSVPKHIANTSTDTFATAPDRSTPPQAQSRSQKPSIDSTTSQRARDSVLNETSPPPRGVHPKRLSSLGAPTDPSKWQNPAEPTVDPSTLPSTPDVVPELRSHHRLSRNALSDSSSPPPPPKANTNSTSKLPPRTSSRQNPTANIENATPRNVPSTASLPAGLKRTTSTMLPNRPSPPPQPTSKSVSMDQSRDAQPNFLRRISGEQHRDYVYSATADPSSAPAKEKQKKRWWQGSSKQKGKGKGLGWVVGRGSRSGTLVGGGG